MSFKKSLKDNLCAILSLCVQQIFEKVCVRLCVIGGFLRQRGEQTAGLWAEILSAITTSNELHCIALCHLHGG